MNNFWTRIISGSVMIFAVVFFLTQPTWGIFLLAGIIGIGSHYEYLKLNQLLNIPNLILSWILFLGILFHYQLSNQYTLFGITEELSALGVTLILLGTYQKWKFWNSFKLLFSHFYISLPLIMFTMIPYSGKNWGAYNAALPIAVMVLVWSSDSWAYVAGKLFGKHKLAPSISPGKTWEGFIGGTLLSGLTGFIIVHFFLSKNGGLIGSADYHTFTTSKGILAGVLVSVFGTAGDLFESSMKRKAGVKDSGNVIPGHGGMLDRFDAFLFAVVVFLIIQRIP